MPSLLIREKVPSKADPTKTIWQFRTIEEGPGIRTSKLQGPFYTRPFIDGRQLAPKRLKATTFAEAKAEAAGLPDKLAADALGVDVADTKAKNRVLIKTAIQTYLDQKRTKAKNTVAAYKNTLEQFAEAVKAKAKFLDEIDVDVLRHYKKFLENEGYEGKTIDTRLNIVFFLLKKNDIKARLPKDEMPVVEEEAAIPYSDEDLKKLFTEMEGVGETVKGLEYSGLGFGPAIRYKFFLGTACRDKEVTFASWADIDFKRKEYHIRRKEDAGFTPKSHESRTVPLPDSLVESLKLRHKNAPDRRWVFVNEDGRPDNHFLRKLKVIAKNAGLNCGHCKHTVTKGRWERQEVEVTCATDPVCDHIYLHRFRKTAATRWLNSGVSVRTVQHYLGHKDLETTMKYLGVEDSQTPEHRNKINDAFGD